MSFRQFPEIRLRDFRCFREDQTARLAPLTLLVGDNSTGKPSFPAAVRAVRDAAHGSGDPGFRKPLSTTVRGGSGSWNEKWEGRHHDTG